MGGRLTWALKGVLLSTSPWEFHPHGSTFTQRILSPSPQTSKTSDHLLSTLSPPINSHILPSKTHWLLDVHLHREIFIESVRRGLIEAEEIVTPPWWYHGTTTGIPFPIVWSSFGPQIPPWGAESPKRHILSIQWGLACQEMNGVRKKLSGWSWTCDLCSNLSELYINGCEEYGTPSHCSLMCNEVYLNVFHSSVSQILCLAVFFTAVCCITGCDAFPFIASQRTWEASALWDRSQLCLSSSFYGWCGQISILNLSLLWF